MTAPLVPRCNADTCVKCRRKLAPGDRVTVVQIVEKLGVNPANRLQMGAWLTGEFEMTHVVCADPTLDNSIIIGGAT